MAYRRDKHLIDAFVWPGDRAGADGTAQGYSIVAWARNGMGYRAVSDLNAAELSGFVGLLRSLR